MPTDINVYIGIAIVVGTVLLFVSLILNNRGTDLVRLEAEKTKQAAIEKGFNPYPVCCHCQEEQDESTPEEEGQSAQNE